MLLDIILNPVVVFKAIKIYITGAAAAAAEIEHQIELVSTTMNTIRCDPDAGHDI